MHPSYCPRNLGFDRQLGVLDLHYGDWRALRDPQQASRQDTILSSCSRRAGGSALTSTTRPVSGGHAGANDFTNVCRHCYFLFARSDRIVTTRHMIGRYTSIIIEVSLVEHP
jgi:hypothetical protein